MLVEVMVLKSRSHAVNVKARLAAFTIVLTFHYERHLPLSSFVFPLSFFMLLPSFSFSDFH